MRNSYITNAIEREYYLLDAEFIELVFEGLFQRCVTVVTIQDFLFHCEFSFSSIQHCCLQPVLYLWGEEFLKDPEAMNALHVVDQLRLAQELVPLGSLRQLLDVVHSDGDQKIHHDHPDEDDEGKDGNMCESRKMIEFDRLLNPAGI